MVLFPSRAGMNPVQKDYDLADDPVPLTRGDEPFEDISTVGALNPVPSRAGRHFLPWATCASPPEFPHPKII